ncbi:S-adenosyl-L-methionine-dependent methyltransferase [Pelagophyceae sp. CCMP2097]|nr:S-adenosyl-L-methionine-dependent methyltransferase [Pelagophyceae sp. CCMP2097]
MSRRPELIAPPEMFYDSKEAKKYTSSSRIISIQAEIADRCIELLNIPAGERRFIAAARVDIGCGSGLSGAVLEEHGHAWVGCDVSRDMLKIASQRVAGNVEESGDEDDEEDDDEEDDDDAEEEEEEEEEEMEEPSNKKPRQRTCASSELIEHDMGLGLPFRDASFDGAISVSALQWLCYNTTSAHTAQRRLGRFFSSLFRCLKRGSRAALQFYPQNEEQATLIATAAGKAGFAGGIVVDYPNSTRAKKYYLCLSMETSYRKPVGADGKPQVEKRQPRKGKKPRKDRDWVLDKKSHARKNGKDVKADTKYTGRKRKDRF